MNNIKTSIYGAIISRNFKISDEKSYAKVIFQHK